MWFKNFFKWIFSLMLKCAADKAFDILNDKTFQDAARTAVIAAHNRGLTGDAAWYSARDAFLAELQRAGTELKDSAIDTLLQLAYYSFKNEKTQ